MFARFKKNFLEPIERPYCYLLLVTCYHWGWCFWETDHVERPYCYLLLVTCYHWGSINMPIPFGKAFSYGTFLQYLRSPGLNALPGRPTVRRGH